MKKENKGHTEIFTTNELFDFYVIEWSEIQGAFHIDKLEDVIKNNLDAYLSGRDSGFYPLLIVESQDETSSLIKRLKSERRKNRSLNLKTPRIIELISRTEKLHAELSEIDAEIRKIRREATEQKKTKK